MSQKQSILWLVLFSTLAAGYRLFFIGKIPLGPDEAYYWTWSLKPAICYFDQPGMVAWVNWIFNHIPSAPTAFTIRLPAVLIMIIATFLAFFCCRELFPSPASSLWFAIAFNFVPIFFFSGMAMIHDTVLILFLLGFYYFSFRLLSRPTPITWLGLSLFLLGAFYSKFNAAIAALSFGLYLVISPFGRAQLKKPWPWLAGLICAAGFLPVVIWNAQRGWPSILATRQLVKPEKFKLLKHLRYFAEYVISQFGVYSPLVLIGIIAALLAGINYLRKNRDERVLLLATLSLPAILYFLLQSLHAPVYGNWSLVGYFPAFLLMSWMSLSGLGKGKVLNRNFWISAIVMAAVISISIPVEARWRFLRPLSWQLKDRFHLSRQLDWRLDQELEGWDELKDFLEENLRPGELLAARRYQIASVMRFLLPDRPMPIVISDGFKQSQFNLWTSPSELAGKWAVYVETREMPEQTRRKFSKVQELGVPFIVYRGQRPVKNFYIYRGYNYKNVPGP